MNPATQYAAGNRGTSNGVETAIAGAPAHIRASINAKRAARGLSTVLSTHDAQRLAEKLAAEKASAHAAEHRGTGVWITGADGRLVPVTTRTASAAARVATRTPARPAARAAAATEFGTRVLILPAYGDATAFMVRGLLPETIAPTAFGPADELNAARAYWDLRYGHKGPRLAIAGQRLRAIDTPHGLVVEWRVDWRSPLASDVVREIEERAGVSVGMQIVESRTVRLPRPTRLIARAKLDHVAILTRNDRPAYAAATAIVFRSSRFDDRGELQEQIDKLVAEARFRSRRS